MSTLNCSTLCFRSLVIGKSWYLSASRRPVLTRVSFADISIEYKKATKTKTLEVDLNGNSVGLINTDKKNNRWTLDSEMYVVFIESTNGILTPMVVLQLRVSTIR